MKNLLKKKSIWIVVPCVLICIILLCVFGGSGDASLYAVSSPGEVIYEAGYQAYLDANGYTGAMSDKEIAVDLNGFTTEDGLVASEGIEGILTEGSGKITWSFTAADAGFYNLELGYIALPGTTSDIQRKLYIDGEICYDDLAQLVIKRWWQDDSITVKNNNELRPEAYEVYSRTEWFVEDYNCRYGEALKFYLAAGEHTITLETIKEPMIVTGLRFCAEERPAAYAEVIGELQAGGQVYSGEAVVMQAERSDDYVNAITKSSQAINIQKNYTDSNIYPYHPYYAVYNTIGRESWENAGDSISWSINVEKDGLYELTFKGRQSTNRGVTSYRRLYINGEVPYLEMNAIGFDYSNDMNNYTVADAQGNPYLFHLNAGENIITLQAVMGPFGSIVSQVEESVEKLNSAYLDVVRLTGQAPSKFIDYQIAVKEPNFAVTMKAESERLYKIVDMLIEITGEKGEQTVLLEKMARQAEGLAEDPELVIKELNQLKNNLSAVGTWLVSISLMPLELDSIILSGSVESLPDPEESFFAGLYNGVVRFFSTFFIDSNAVGAVEGQENEALKVWVVSYGKEQAQIIKNMADDTFSADTGTNVKVQLIPADVVLRAALAGNGPDVVIGLSQSTAQDFAMRGASVNLTELPGYEEIASQYFDSTLDAASFNDGVYGFAEQANFMMMFYREDIINQLGIGIPATWEEFIEIIPVLQQNNYSAYVPNAYLNDANGNLNFYLSMVYQYGGDVYKGSGDDYGIESALDSDAAMEAFKDYTDLFVNYGLNVQVDFSNRFRTGEFPIGLVNYTTFCTLEIFAPEIKGLWSFAPIPGMLREDGTIDNTVVTDTVQAIIMSSSDKREAAWSFLQWWVSEDTQLKFATSTEAIMGTAARFPSAIPKVLEQLPWSYSELNSLLSQFENSVGIKAVPGYYMTNRMIAYSYGDVLTETSNPREALYLNIKSINQELTNKREQLGLSFKE